MNPETQTARARAAGLGLGVDIGGTSARTAVVELATGEVLGAANRKHVEHGGTGATFSPEAVADLAAALLRESLQSARPVLERRLPGIELGDFGHVGVAFAGPLSRDRGVWHVRATNIGPPWSTPVPFGEMLTERLGLPSVLVNDVHGSAVDALERYQHALHITVGSGLGGAEKVHGRIRDLQPGATPVHARGGRPLEDFVGGMAVARMVQRDLEAGVETSLRTQVVHAHEAHAGHVEAAYQQGDPYAVKLWREAGLLVGAHLARLARGMAAPVEAIVWGGGVLLKSSGLAQMLEAGFAEAIGFTPATGFFQRASHGEAAGLIGAAKLELVT